MFRLLFILLYLLFLLPSQISAQSAIKKVNFTVIDAVTGKPVEGAEIIFKALIGKVTKKTNSEGKATFDMVLLMKSMNMNYTVKYPNSSKTYKTYTGTITLMDNKNSYDYTAPIQPDVKTISFKISDDKRQPLSNATVKLKDAKGNEVLAQSDANGVAMFQLSPDANFSNASLLITKAGFADYILPVEINDQTSQVAVVAPLVEKQQVIIVDGTGDVTNTKKELPGVTDNVTVTHMPPGYSAAPMIPDPVWGPYKPECDVNPVARVPVYTPLAVEDEQTVIESVFNSCIKPANEAINSLIEMTESLVSIRSKLYAVWHHAFETQKQTQLIQASKKLYDDTKKIAEDDAEKTKKAVDDAIEKTKKLYEKMEKFAKGPQMYILKCIGEATLEYALPSIAKLKDAVEGFDEAKEKMQEKLEKIQKRLSSGAGLSWSDKELFTDWGDVTENMQKTNEGLNLIVALIKDPKQVLPYRTQVNLAISTAEAMIAALMTDCQIRECDRQIKQGIAAAQAGLTAARKLYAQKRKGETKWRQILNDYVTKHNKQEDRGWEHWGPNDFRLQLLPEGAYGSWVNYHNEAIAATRDSANFNQSLNRLATLCQKLQPIAATLNERIKKYEGLYNSGLIAVENCKLDGAQNFVKQLQSLENSQCGHFFPRPYGKTKSEELHEKINKARQSGKCPTEKGVYILKNVVVEISNEYYKLTETEFAYQSDKNDAEKEGYVFNLLNKPPSAIKPGQSFSLSFSARCRDANPVSGSYTNIKWTGPKNQYTYESGWNNLVKVCNYEGKLERQASGSVKIIVPEFSGTELILNVAIGAGSVYEWVKFVYERNN